MPGIKGSKKKTIRNGQLVAAMGDDDEMRTHELVILTCELTDSRILIFLI